MPNIIDEEIDAYAWCGTWSCPGSYQQPVRAIKQTIEQMVGDLTGDWSRSAGYDPRFVERSTSPPLKFVDEADGPCKACGKWRELGEGKAVKYEARSGHRQDGLRLIHKFGTVDAAVRIESALSAAKLDLLVASDEKERKRHQLRVDELQQIWDRGTAG